MAWWYNILLGAVREKEESYIFHGPTSVGKLLISSRLWGLPPWLGGIAFSLGLSGKRKNHKYSTNLTGVRNLLIPSS